MNKGEIERADFVGQSYDRYIDRHSDRHAHILHCAYCKRQWEVPLSIEYGISYATVDESTIFNKRVYSSLLEEFILPQMPKTIMEPTAIPGPESLAEPEEFLAILEKPKVTLVEPDRILEGLYQHEKVVCENCLPQIPDLYMLKPDEPLFQKAERVRQHISTYSAVLNDYVDKHLDLMSPQQIRELAKRCFPHALPKKKFNPLKNKIISEICYGFEKSATFQEWTQKGHICLSSLKKEAKRLAQHSFYRLLEGLPEGSPVFYIADQRISLLLYRVIAEEWHSFKGIMDTYLWNHLYHPYGLSQDKEEISGLSRPKLADMPAFLQSKGVDPDTLFDGGRRPV